MLHKGVFLLFLHRLAIDELLEMIFSAGALTDPSRYPNRRAPRTAGKTITFHTRKLSGVSFSVTSQLRELLARELDDATMDHSQIVDVFLGRRRL
jgi:hypothetical protein